MRKSISLALLCIATPIMAQAQSADADRGREIFHQCQSCHVVESPEGQVLAGSRGDIGPNLYGIAGRPAAIQTDFDYSDSLARAGRRGLEWDEAHFVDYMQGPTPFLRAYLDSNTARGKMPYLLRSEQDARDVYAFLAQFTD